MPEGYKDIETAPLRLGRRGLLRGGALLAGGLAAAALIGCGGDDEGDEAASQAPGAGGTQTAVDMGDATRGRLVRDESLPFPYNYPEPNKQPKAGGVMKVAATWDVGPMDPTVSAAGGTVTVPNMVYNRLLGAKRGPAADPFKMELAPELAQSWERSPDGMAYTFKIRPGIKWQNLPPLNGRAFTAADAKFALERYQKEGVHKAYYLNVASFEAVDPATLKINMKRATADFLNPLASDKQTIFPRELVENGDIQRKVIGTGPMILKEAVSASHVSFEKNPEYFNRKVLLDGFEFRVMPDVSSRLAAFRAGQVDYAYSPVSSLSEVKTLQKSNSDLQINILPLVTMTFTMQMNPQKYPDERVRRAVSMAINRQQIIDVVFEGLGKATNIIPWTYLFNEEPTIQSGLLGKWTKYDPTEAKKLLQAAGQEKITMQNAYYAYTAANDKTAEIVVPMFREVGITLAGGKVDYTEFNSQWVGGKIADVSTSAWGTSGFDADNWFQGQVHSQSAGNRWKINDRQIDEWADQQQVELDPQKRKDIQRKIWDRDLDMMYRPSFPLGFTYEVLQPWMRGIRWNQTTPNANGSYYYWGSQVENGWLDK